MMNNNPENTKAVIFTGFANPHGDLTCLTQEQHGIQDVLSALEKQGQFQKLLQRTDLSLTKYFDILRTWENKINIFHFGGHANSQDIRLQDRSIFFEPLAQELNLRNPDALQLVFLNGCATEPHVQTLFDLGVKAVIATSVSIGDQLASLFAICFYQNLAQGDTIGKAFQSTFHYAEAQQKGQRVYRILEQPVDWALRDSVQKDEEDKGLPWGLYVNDKKALNYTIIGAEPSLATPQNSPTQVIQGNQINTANDQGTIITGPVTGGVNISHDHTQHHQGNTNIQVENSKVGRDLNINKPKS
ncbi:hypothetical protein BKI52_19375 [marine bacterium AO1-C]|nr:hypothetical protein BKI52_19375 [marine bacterium AO1-C]